MQEIEVVLTNYHPRGFAFGCRVDNGDNVFIPPFVRNVLDINPGQKAVMTIIPNDQEHNTCPWKAAGVSGVSVDQPLTDADTDAVSALLSDGEPQTIGDISERLSMSFANVLEAAARIPLNRVQILDHRGIIKKTYLIQSMDAAVAILEGVCD